MFCDSAVIKLQIALFFLLFSSVIQADTLVILERSGTLTFTHSLAQELQKKQLPEHVHVGYVDTIYSTLKPDTKSTSIELYKSAILSSAGIDEFTPIDKVISQGSASARFLEDHPELFSQAERFFTHIAWQPTTGTLIPSDVNVIENIRHLTTLFPQRTHLLLIGNIGTDTGDLIKLNIDVTDSFPSIARVNDLDYQSFYEEINELTVNTQDMVALITNPPVVQSELATLNWLKAQSIPILFLFANHLDLEVYKTVGGLVVDPIKIADIIATLANNDPVSPQQHNVTTALYHADAIEKYNLEPDTYSTQYQIIGEHYYTKLDAQIFTLSALVILIFILLLYIKSRFEYIKLLSEKTTIAEKANQAKDILLANISHELRTPLNAINLAFYSLGQHQKDEDSPLIKAGQKSTAHLKSIVDNVLDYHQTSINAMQVNLEWSNKDNLLDAIKLHQHAAQAKALHFNIIGYNELPSWLYTDEKLFIQILHNILSNALKFTENGAITMTFTHTPEQLSMAIADTGIGMSESTIADIFEPFKQADLSIRKKYQGTGLGMALCDNLITLLKGRLDIQSTLGKGTTFTVTVPIKFQDSMAEETPTTIASTRTLLDLELLIVEDEPINRELMSYAIADQVTHVNAVESAKAALEFIAEHKVDVVLTDIQMPDMDGTELFYLLRKQLPDLPIIAITGNVLPHEQQLYAEMGFNAVLGKPFNMAELMDILEQHFYPQNR